MLQIEVNSAEYYDEQKNEFLRHPSIKLNLEHSLLSISKWESKWAKSYFDENTTKTKEELIDYIRCMIVSPADVSELVLNTLIQNHYSDIYAYVNAPMTATVFSSNRKSANKNKEFVTSELVYYWMILYGIPFECQKWHIHRLLTLIRICSIKQSTNNKMSKSDSISYIKNENERRKAMWNTRG